MLTLTVMELWSLDVGRTTLAALWSLTGALCRVSVLYDRWAIRQYVHSFYINYVLDLCILHYMWIPLYPFL